MGLHVGRLAVCQAAAILHAAGCTCTTGPASMNASISQYWYTCMKLIYQSMDQKAEIQESKLKGQMSTWSILRTHSFAHGAMLHDSFVQRSDRSPVVLEVKLEHGQRQQQTHLVESSWLSGSCSQPSWVDAASTQTSCHDWVFELLYLTCVKAACNMLFCKSAASDGHRSCICL